MVDKDGLHLNITIPANTTATVYIPDADPAKLMEGKTAAAKAEGVKFLRTEGGSAVYEVGSGSYAFSLGK